MDAEAYIIQDRAVSGVRRIADDHSGHGSWWILVSRGIDRQCSRCRPTRRGRVRNLLSHIPRLGGVGLDEASIRFVFSKGGRKHGRSSRDATVSSFPVAEVHHTLLVVGVKYSVIILIVGIRVASGSGRRSSSISIIHVSSAECHHRFRGLSESGVEHLQESH